MGPSTSRDQEMTVFAETYLDVRTGELKNEVVIEIENGRVSSIVSASKDSIEGEFVDLTGLTVLPGLIDSHTHLCDNSYMGNNFDHWAYPAATFGIVGVVNARKTLFAGFTTVRDVSAPFYCDVALRDAIARGWVPGPRMFVTGPMLTMTGGHGSWGNWIAPQHEVSTDAHLIADGVSEIRKAVRTLVRNNVDVVKVAATGGYGTHGTIPGAASFSIEELSVVVEEARNHGITVAAHAHGPEGIRNAVTAGVTSVDHASMIDDDGIRLMRKNGTFAVVDLLSAHFDLIELNQNYDDKNLGHSNSEEYVAIVERFRAVYDSGVKIAFGTDAGVYPHGRNAEQFRLMVDAGMSHIDAIRSATIVAADLLGQQDNIGELAVGRYADFIAVRGNPLENIDVLKDARVVAKEGEIVLRKDW
jgi:imidazolonepropionase-like amidohydrolase